MKFIKWFFAFILCLQAFWANAQTDAWEQMQEVYYRLRDEQKSDSILLIARKMNAWALKNETDTSLRYAISLRNLGNELGTQDSAFYYLIKSTEALENQKRKETLDYALSITNLGIYFNKKLDYEKAEQYLLQDLNLRAKIIGDTSIDYSTSLNNLGIFYYERNSFQNSIKYFTSALEIRKKNMDEDDPNLMTIINNLGRSYWKLSMFKSAEPYFEYLVKIKKTVKEHEPRAYITSITDMGNLYFNMKLFEKSENCFLEVAEISEKYFTEMSSEYTNSIFYLGSLYSEMNDLKKADSCFILLYKYYKNTNNFFALANVSFSLGNIFLEKGLYNKSYSYFYESEKIIRENFSSKPAIFSNILNNIGIVNENLGKYEDAKKYYLEAIGYIKKTDGDSTLGLALSLTNLGALYKYLGELNSALIFIKAGFNIRKLYLKSNPEEYVISLINLAAIYQALGQFSEAECYYLESIFEFENSIKKESVEYSKLLNNYGTFCLDRNLFSKARNLLDMALEVRIKINGENHPDLLEIYENISLLNRKLSDFGKAEVNARKSIEIAKINFGTEKVQYADALTTMACVLADMNKNIEAESLYKQALIIQKNFFGEKNLDYAFNIINVGNLKMKQGLYDSASHFYLKGLQIKKDILGEEHPKYLGSLTLVGVLLAKGGKLNEAENWYFSSLDLIRKSLGKSSDEYSDCLRNLGTLWVDMGKFKDAEICLLESIKIKEKVFGVNSLEIYYGLLNLGNLYSMMGNYELSYKVYQRSKGIVLLNVGEESSEYAVVINNLGIHYMNINDLATSNNFFSKSLKIKQKIFGDSSLVVGENFHNLGLISKKQHKFNQAYLYYLQALRIKEKWLGKEHSSCASSNAAIGNLLVELKEYDLAEQYINRAKDIRLANFGDHHPDYIKSLYSLGHLELKRNQCINAVNKYYQANLLSMDNIQDAFTWQAEIGKNKYWNLVKSSFEEMPSLSAKIECRFPEANSLAYNSTLFSKSFLFQTSRELDQVVANSSDSILKKQYGDIKLNRRICSKLQSEGSDNKELIDNFKAKADSLDKILVNKLGAFAAAKRKFEISSKDVQAKLSKDEAAIEFARYYNDADSSYKYLALVLRPGYPNPAQVLLGSEDQIEAATQNLDFGQLYQLVWKGLDSLLSGVHKVYYSPAGVLNNVAFSALCFQGGEKVNSSCNNFLVTRGEVPSPSSKNMKFCQSVLMDRYELHQLSTTRYLADGSLEKGLPLRKEVALIGGVNYDVIPKTGSGAKNEGSEADFAFHINLKSETRGIDKNKRSGNGFGFPMPYLAGTNEEVHSISNLLKPTWKVQTRIGEFATEKQFKASLSSSRPGVLHIATHGFAFPEPEEKRTDMTMMMVEKPTYKVSEDPMVRCGLMLSGSNISWTGNPQKMIEKTGEDGILTAAEVAGMDLSDTKLVVLSACETGKGKIEGSEGTMGLKRGFKLAGVEQLIVSLWAVPDKETSELMTLFYADLAKTMNPVSSFEKAQKEMRKRYPADPEKWAGFVLIR